MEINERNNQLVIILRGLQGSGKTTLARKIIKHFSLNMGTTLEFIERDMFYPKRKSKYDTIADSELIKSKDAYLAELDRLLVNQKPFIVANVFNRNDDYMSIAKSALNVHGYSNVIIIEMTSQFTSVNCPAAVTAQYAEKWQPSSQVDFSVFPESEKPLIAYYKANRVGCELVKTNTCSNTNLTSMFRGMLGDIINGYPDMPYPKPEWKVNDEE